MIERKSLISFLLVSFGLAWLFFLLPLAFGNPGTPTYQTTVMICWSLAMWAPGIASIITTRFINKQPLSTLNMRHFGPWRIYVLAWLVPPLLAIVTGMLTLLLGAGKLDLSFSFIRETLKAAPGETNLSPSTIVAIQIALAFTFAPLFNTVFAMGEELGWRGFLLPKLMPLGQWKAILISSAIWGLWHAPAVVQGLNYPGYPVLGIAMMIVWCMLIGVGISWVYLKTQSPWAPALAHGSLNATVGIPMLFLKDVNIVIGGSLTSVIGWIGLAGLVVWMFVRRQIPVEM